MILAVLLLFLTALFILFGYSYHYRLKRKQQMIEDDRAFKINVTKCLSNPKKDHLNKLETAIDICWYYDDTNPNNRLVWVIPENFFLMPKEKLEKSINQLKELSSQYCEVCNSFWD